MIYIACPGNYATGGTELLHQLSYALKKYTNQVRIFYYSGEAITPERFNSYDVILAESIEDDEKNIIIVPEVATHLLKMFQNIKKIVWWLSVDNYYSQIKIRKDEFIKSSIRSIIKVIRIRNYFSHKVNFRDENLVHCVQSRYAKDFLDLKGVQNIYFLSDYLNSTYMEVPMGERERLDQILYNPKKGFGFTEKIIRQCPEYTFIPLEKMTPKEVAILCETSKIYIDFGPHPGKDRFPREAAILGCVVLVGKRGSAVNQIDIPIDDSYKFPLRKASITLIRKRIQEIFQNFEDEQRRFDEYRLVISSEKTNFDHEVESLFQSILNKYV
jgi:hypothetical protein